MYTRTPLDVVPTTRRNLAFDLARGAASIHDADRDRYLPQMRTALALGLRILRAQRREEDEVRRLDRGCPRCTPRVCACD